MWWWPQQSANVKLQQLQKNNLDAEVSTAQISGFKSDNSALILANTQDYTTNEYDT